MGKYVQLNGFVSKSQPSSSLLINLGLLCRRNVLDAKTINSESTVSRNIIMT